MAPIVHSILLTALLIAAASNEAAAQWAVSAEIGAARFWGGSREVEGNRAFRPYRPTLLGVGVERLGHRVGVGVRLYHANASLALEGPDAVVAVKDALEVFGVATALSVRLGRIGNRVQLVARGGPLVEVWRLADESSNTRAGFGASVGLRIGLEGRWSCEVQAGIGVTASPFTQADLDSGFGPRALWRRELGGSLRYRL